MVHRVTHHRDILELLVVHGSNILQLCVFMNMSSTSDANIPSKFGSELDGGRDDAIPAQKWSEDMALQAKDRANSLSVADRASLFERPRTTTSSSSPRAEVGPGSPSRQPTNTTTTTQPSWFGFLGGNNKATMEYCASPNCRRAVYKAERMSIAAGIVYHRPCFLCGGGTTNGCKRLLTLDAYEVLQGLPFCVHCCRKIQSGSMALHR